MLDDVGGSWEVLMLALDLNIGVSLLVIMGYMYSSV